MKNCIKLICLDLDGTTLKDISNISKENIQSIRKANDKGIKIALTTGRLFIHGMYFSKIIGIDSYIIGNNGTYVYDTSKDKIIYSSFLGVDNLVKIYKFVKGKNFNVHYSTIDTIYSNVSIRDHHNETEKGNYAMKEVIVENEEEWISIFEKHGNEICKAVAYSDEISKLEILINEIKNTNEFEVEYSWENTVEILKKGDGKGTGVRNLKNYLGINTNNVMCIGDSENDISMFGESGYKVAMGNAIEILKEKSDFVTLGVLENGVSYAIEKLLEQYS